jgi:hypothetical protein
MYLSVNGCGMEQPTKGLLGTIVSEVHQTTTIDLDDMIKLFSGLKTCKQVKADARGS